ncbi:hypothetical protein ACMD2_02883 [Ananas comosus]|uniref:DUF1664 domain-containing protein n=1 Tax=Ananas comosus TaxID=4615 RepID=A0A199VE77_ANACO|nr:hypothetical protein ACMD2_02883 [Ananas comosus]
MAMQSGIATSKVLILVGAGLTGSIILKNGRLSDVLAELQELVKGVNEGEASSGHYDTALLAAQIRHLAQEVRDLALSRPVTVLTGDSNSRGNLASYIVPAATGWSFSDVMFVTKRNMANAVANVSKQLEQVSAALAATKRHLTQRLENVDGKLDEQREISKSIMNEVNEVRTDLSQIGFDIESIQKMVAGLEGKIGLLENKQDISNAGIWYLCQVAGGIKDGINAKFFQEANEKLKLSHSFTPSEDNTLKGLQFLADNNITAGETADLKADTAAKTVLEKPTKGSFVKSNAIHRSYTGNFSVRKEGLAL